MPSVGMRRTTRVFGVVKGIDGARVLRSGRCLWPESDDSKVKTPHRNDEHLLTNIENKRSIRTGLRSQRHADAARHKCNSGSVSLERVVIPMDVDEGGKCNNLEFGKKGSLDDRNEKVRDKMFGLVYSRKRKRQDLEGVLLGQGGCKSVVENKSLAEVKSSAGEAGCSLQNRSKKLVLALHVNASRFLSSGSYRSIGFADLLFLVLSYLRKRRVSLLQLYKFLMSSPICRSYSSHGVRLLPGSPISSSGLCQIFGAGQHMPLFSVDFSAVPLCFLYMHSSMLLGCRFMPVIYVYSLVNEKLAGILLSDDGDLTEGIALVSEASKLEKKSLLQTSVRSSKLASRTAAYRNGVYSRSIQKRRSSLRSRRGRNSPLVSVDKPNGSLVSDLINRRKFGIPFSSVAPNKHRISSLFASLEEGSGDLVGSKQNVQSTCCSANILVIEEYKCYREEGAYIVLEMSDSGEWSLSVKRDGHTKYSHKAQKVMRPPSSNRVSHNIIWTADIGWKLEFPKRHDWMIFKEIYRECFHRNAHLYPTVKVIPVPVVREVFGYCDQNVHIYCRPDSYITMKNDEVSRALAKETACYDMDIEDEEWLNKFNNDFFGVKKFSEHLTPENFELMIDAFEKAYYCSPDDISDEKAAVKFCPELGQRDVIEAIYSYWMKKREQKKSALIRVFQVQQPKRTSSIPKAAPRKKRSFKRHRSQCARSKQPSHLRAVAVEQSAQVEPNALERVELLKASAKKSLELAIQKRKRAQFLMENADLATYKATMALKIAEAAQYAESPDFAASLF